MHKNISVIKGYFSDPFFLFSASILLLLLAFFAEMAASFSPPDPDNSGLVMIQLLFVFSVLLNNKLVFPQIHKIPKVLLWITAAWLVWVFMAALNGLDQYHSMLYFAELLVYLLFVASIWAFMVRYSAIGWYVLVMILVGFLLYTIYFSINYLFSSVSTPFEIAVTNLNEVGFRHLRHFGYYLMIAVVVSLGCCLQTKFNWRNPLMWLGTITSVVAWTLIFWAGGRGPFFAFFVSLVMFLLMVRVKHYPALLLLITSSLLLGAALSFSLPKGMGMGMGRIVFMYESSSDLNQFSSNRLKIWRGCLSDIAKRPLLGNGPYGFKDGCGEEYFNNHGTLHPHGIHIQAPLDWGVPGALLFFAMITLTLWHAWLGIRGDRGDGISINSVGLWLALMLLVYSSISGPLFFRFSVMFFSLAIALSLLPKDSKAIAGSQLNSRRPYMLMAMSSLSIFFVMSFIE